MSTAKGPLKGRAARLGRLMPSGPSSAARTPFVLLVVVLLGGGLISLLLLNSALNQGSFQLNELKDRTTELTDEEQALQRDVDDYAAPDALERRARELGMVPGGSPAFLGPDGKVLGEPSVAVAPKPSPTAGASVTPSAFTGSPEPGARADASGTAAGAAATGVDTAASTGAVTGAGAATGIGIATTTGATGTDTPGIVAGVGIDTLTGATATGTPTGGTTWSGTSTGDTARSDTARSATGTRATAAPTGPSAPAPTTSGR
ncbi:septum formation initiator family protein [Streptomyces sp. NPDC058664]|uniref:FtsB family cell division protein n=1 Tax=unclassified Streptomyces TaxID=2593676 RepID=UPI003659BB01